MVEGGGSVEAAKGQGRNNFCGGKDKAGTGIYQAWRERGMVGGEEHGQQRICLRQGTLV